MLSGRAGRVAVCRNCAMSYLGRRSLELPLHRETPASRLHGANAGLEQRRRDVTGVVVRQLCPVTFRPKERSRVAHRCRCRTYRVSVSGTRQPSDSARPHSSGGRTVCLL
jgi:hypothetical protein